MKSITYAGLAPGGLPVVRVDTRHMRAALSAQLNKTDRHDARGVAQMMRVVYKPVHVKTPTSQSLRTILTARQMLRTKLLDLENEIRGFLRDVGYDFGKLTARDFEWRVRELGGDTDLMVVVAPLLTVRGTLREKGSHALTTCSATSPVKMQYAAGS
jgi:transposase